MKAPRGLWAIIALVCCLAFSSALAQPGGPEINVYFDEALTQTEIDCPGPGLDTLEVVAENFGDLIFGVEFKVNLPSSVIWLADIGTPFVTLGTTASGISIAWPGPQDATTSLVITRMIILWNCVDCNPSSQGTIEVVMNSITSFLGASTYPNHSLVDAVGGTATVCAEPEDVVADLDIKPGSCPNAFNIKLFEFLDDGKPKKGGVLPVALHGSADFDVADVDISSLLLEGVAPLSRGSGPHIADMGAAKHGACDCTANSGSDSYPDLNMKFSSQEIAAAIPSGQQPGDDYELTLTGTLLDGTPFTAADCIHFVGQAEPPVIANEAEGPMLVSASPNPFNPLTHIRYYIPSEAMVRLTVHNVRGERVATLVHGAISGGDHVVTWDARGFPSGVYFYRLNVGTFSDTRKLVLLK